MKSYLAFTHKEFVETARTYKLLIMASVFLILGMMNPITAKITPQLLQSFMPEGMEITIGEPTAMDSWTQFFKNIPQMGLIVLVIVFSGMMANEFSRGTLINVLTKGLSRKVVILSKFSMAVSLWTGSYALCFGVTYGYTAYFWPGFAIPNIVFSALCLWLFAILLLACILFSGVLFKNSYGSLLFTGVFAVILLLVNIIPTLQKYNPIALASSNMKLLQNTMQISDFVWPVVLCCILIVGFMISAVLLLNKKQI